VGIRKSMIPAFRRGVPSAEEIGTSQRRRVHRLRRPRTTLMRNGPGFGLDSSVRVGYIQGTASGTLPQSRPFSQKRAKPYELSVTGRCLRKEERINSPAAIQIQLSATLNEGQAYSRT